MRLIIIILSIVIALLLVGIVVFILLGGFPKQSEQRRNQSLREIPGSTRLVVDQGTADSVMDQMRQEVADGMFECQMSMTWTFEDGSAESKDAYVANSVNNKYPIYFDVYLNESDEEPIYSSPVLPVGTDWSYFKLDKPVPAGEYKSKVLYTLVRDLENQEQISQAAFIVNLYVLK